MDLIHKYKYKKAIGDRVQIEWDAPGVVKRIEAEIAKVNQDGARLAANYARQFVPKKTGALHDSIQESKSRYGDDWVVRAGNEKVDYAFHVETGRYNRKTRTRVPAQPFMRKSIRKSKKQIQSMLFDRLKRLR